MGLFRQIREVMNDLAALQRRREEAAARFHRQPPGQAAPLGAESTTGPSGSNAFPVFSPYIANGPPPAPVFSPETSPGQEEEARRAGFKQQQQQVDHSVVSFSGPQPERQALFMPQPARQQLQPQPRLMATPVVAQSSSETSQQQQQTRQQIPTAPTQRGGEERGLEDNSPSRSLLTPAQVASTLPLHGLALGYVIRVKGGILSQPKYTFFFERRDQFVLASRKRDHKQTSNYLLSTDPTDLDRNSDSFFAKVRSNFGGTEFVFYDSGEGDERSEIGAILYEADPAGLKGPRRMLVLLPRVTESGDMDQWRPKTDQETLIAEYRRNPESDRLIVLQNKAPQWNESLRAFQLNFHGRVAVSSVKNCQLVDTRQPNRLVMQFGKVTNERFSLDFQFPLNATQAFSIALTSFDNKLLCE